MMQTVRDSSCSATVTLVDVVDSCALLYVAAHHHPATLTSTSSPYPLSTAHPSSSLMCLVLQARSPTDHSPLEERQTALSPRSPLPHARRHHCRQNERMNDHHIRCNRIGISIFGQIYCTIERFAKAEGAESRSFGEFRSFHCVR